MPDVMKQWSAWVEMWRSQPSSKRLMYSLVGVSLCAGLVLFSVFSMRSNEVPLMTNLTEEDAQEIITRLQDMRVPYRLASGGTAVLVAEEDVHQIRIKLAGEGMPRSGGVGFELFDKNTLGSSRFSEQIRYLRALEGELTRTIRTLEVVKDVRVHLVMGEDSLFKSQSRPSSASVSLSLRRGRTPSEEHIQSIIHLVASSVPHLKAENITVVDTLGHLLSRGGEERSPTSGAWDVQKKHEQDVERRVTELVEHIVGRGKATVRATVYMDLTQRDEVIETFDPENVAVRSEQVTEESASENGSSGAAAPENAQAGANNASNEPGKSKKIQTRNYEINKTVRHEVAPSGRISKISVAVLLDGIEIKNQKGDLVVKERSPEETKRIVDIVRGAIGYDESRGDQITVQSIPFEREKSSSDEVEKTWKDWVKENKFKFASALGSLIFLMIFVSYMRKKFSSISSEIIMVPQTVREIEASMQKQENAYTTEGIGLIKSDIVIPAQETPVPKIMPSADQAAKVIKTWMSE
jgi:flagellar M-ring protein FliF